MLLKIANIFLVLCIILLIVHLVLMVIAIYNHQYTNRLLFNLGIAACNILNFALIRHNELNKRRL